MYLFNSIDLYGLSEYIKHYIKLYKNIYANFLIYFTNEITEGKDAFLEKKYQLCQMIF